MRRKNPMPAIGSEENFFRFAARDFDEDTILGFLDFHTLEVEVDRSLRVFGLDCLDCGFESVSIGDEIVILVESDLGYVILVAVVVVEYQIVSLAVALEGEYEACLAVDSCRGLALYAGTCTEQLGFALAPCIHIEIGPACVVFDIEVICIHARIRDHGCFAVFHEQVDIGA